MGDNPGPSTSFVTRYSNKTLTNVQLLRYLEDSDSGSGDWNPDSDLDGSSSSTENEEEAPPISNSLSIPPVLPVFNAPAAQISDNVTWNNTGMLRKFPFTGQQGLLVPIPLQGKPIDFFQLIIDDDFLRLIVNQTNENAARILFLPKTSENSRITDWKDITVDELKIFFGLLLHTGTIQLNRLNDYWKTDPLFAIPAFRKYMSRNRFLIILRCIYFSSPEIAANDRLGKIRPVVDYFNEKMKNIYYPGRELSLDEAMVLWRGRLQFKQFIKNKRHKYGLKLYMLTEPNGLIQKFHVYEGSTDVYSGVGHTEKIVCHLLEEKLGKGHAVYLDNYYNSVNLASKLLEQNTYCTGTLQANRKNNPQEVMAAKIKRGENKSMFFNGVHVGKWRDKRNVTYITTEFENEIGVFRNKRGQESEKPVAVIGYNKYMSGIDRQDQMMAYYPCNRKSIRWYKKLFVHVLQMSVINAYFLYNKYIQSGSLYDFRIELIRSLLSSKDLQCVRPITKNLTHVITKIEKNTKEKKGVKETKRVSRKECKECRKKKLERKLFTNARLAQEAQDFV